MSNRELSTDAKLIMDALYGLLDLMERHESKYKYCKRYLSKENLKHFISRVEEKLEAIR